MGRTLDVGQKALWPLTRYTIRFVITNRREILKTLAAAPFALQAKESPAPNILFVLSDDHSYPYLGAYGASWM